MKNLRYICVQPRILYYAWQVEVMINNFIKQGINPNNIDILVACNPDDLTSTEKNIEIWNKLAEHYNSVRFFFYQDTRKKPINYISSVRPNILKQHFNKFPELEKEAIFYHDCDILFTRKPDFTKFLNDDIWYLSDTNSYINCDYILSKGKDVYDRMCEIVGMHPAIPKLMRSDSGGAQYILKNVNHDYWQKVEDDCENLYKEISIINSQKKKENEHYHELQIWCADMWAVLWNGWLLGYKTKIVPEMDFSWGTDPISRWEEKPIYHNAGITCSCEGQFYKPNYREKLPYGIDDRFNKTKNGYKYFLEVKETGEKSCLI